VAGEDIFKEISQIKQDLSSIRTDINWIRGLLDKLDTKIQELSNAISAQRNYTNQATGEVRDQLLKKISEMEERLNKLEEFTSGVKTSVKVLYAITSAFIALASVIIYLVR